MPRLIPTRSRWRDNQVLVAVEEIPSTNVNSLRPGAYRGEVFRGSHSLVRTHPDKFAEAPAQPGPPGLNEPYAIPIMPFLAPDGRLIWGGIRFNLYDPLVLDFPAYFSKVIPNEG